MLFRSLQPVRHVHKIQLADLRGIDRQIGRVEQNALQFIEGRPANNVLLTGARGTGKSSLVKTAFFASDPNLGRILAAIGNAGLADLDPSSVGLKIGDVTVVDRGARAASYTEEQGQRAMKPSEITIAVTLGRGVETATVWTCDFSYDYVKINADYRS